jgi:hypothetical protein
MQSMFVERERPDHSPARAMGGPISGRKQAARSTCMEKLLHPSLQLAQAARLAQEPLDTALLEHLLDGGFSQLRG